MNELETKRQTVKVTMYDGWAVTAALELVQRLADAQRVDTAPGWIELSIPLEALGEDAQARIEKVKSELKRAGVLVD